MSDTSSSGSTASEKSSPFENNLPPHPPPAVPGTDEDKVVVIDKKLIKQRINDYVVTISSSALRENPTNLDIYSGSSGIAFAFWYLSTRPAFEREEQKYFLDQALQYIDPVVAKLDEKRKSTGDKLDAKDKLTQPVDEDTGLLREIGSYLVAALIYHSTKADAKLASATDKYLKAAATFLPDNLDKPRGGDNFSTGRAGYVYGAQLLNKTLGVEVVPAETLKNLVKYSKQSATRASKDTGLQDTCPLVTNIMGKPLLGVLYGLTSVLLALLQMNEATDDVYASIDHILSVQGPDGRFPISSDGDASAGPVTMCEGTTGVFYVVAKAFLVRGEKKYMDSCEKAAEAIWARGLNKFQCICHGVAGNTYALLAMYRLSGYKAVWLHRAVQFYEFMHSEQFEKEVAGSPEPFGLFEGLSGIMILLADLLEPRKANFPLFFNIFE